jgi:DNA replication protein DnaC
MSETQLSVELRRLSHELRLFGINQSIERLSGLAMRDGLHPLEYLRLVLDEEKRFRFERTAKMLKTRAKFRSDAELEDWDHEFPRKFSKQQFRDVASLEFHRRRESLIIMGATGSGKTHLAIALGKKLCAEGVKVHFYSLNLLLEESQAEKIAGKYLNFIKRMRSQDVLIFDDFGLRNYTHEEAQILIDILEERYMKGSVIVTSQVDPAGWLRLFQDPVIAEAIVDRLTKPALQLRFEVKDSYRSRVKYKKELGSERSFQ